MAMATPQSRRLVRLLWAGYLSVLLSLAALGSVQAQDGEPGFANAARLGNILVDGLSIGYVDDGTTTSYTGPTVGHCASSTPVTVFIGSYASYLQASVNGSPPVSVSYSSGSSASVNANLNFGDNLLTVDSFANGDTMRYDITVRREAATSNADLGNLTISGSTLDSAFDSANTSYTASVSTDRITLTPTTADCSTVTVNGAAVASGSPSGAIALSLGSNAIPVLVTAQDGTTKAYTVTVTRIMSADANLAGLSLSAGSLSPAFGSATFDYTASVAYSVSSVTVTSTPASSTATVTVNGTAVPNASASAPIALAVGANVITVRATAEDGAITKTYSVLVTRAPSVDLSALALSSGSLSPAFASGTSTYTVSVANAVASLSVTPTAFDANVVLTVNGTAVANASASDAIALSVSSNTLTVVVAAQGGSPTRTYTVVVTRAAAAEHFNNDTGQATCNEGNNQVACTPANSGDTATMPRQDGRFGRDAAARARVLPKTGAGAAGFDYTRVCMSGELAGQGVCPFSPARGTAPNDWACTKDHVTGLTWSLASSALYTWADAASTYPAALNAARHCGYTTGWRLPTRRELLSIVHSGVRNPAIDSAYFPNMVVLYWSADTYVPIPARAWIVDFIDGRTDHYQKQDNLSALLVRSGQ